MNRYPGLLKALGLLILIALLTWWWLFSRAFPASRAVPSQATLTVWAADFGQLDAALRTMPPALQALQVAQELRVSLKHAQLSFAPELNQLTDLPLHSLAAAFSLQPTDSLQPVVILEMPSPAPAKALIERLAKRATTRRYQFKGHELFTLQKKNSSPLTVARVRNLIIFSGYSYLVEDALVQTEQSNPTWAAILGDQKAGAVQIGLRMDQLPERCKGWMAPWWKNLPEQASREMQSLRAVWKSGRWILEAQLAAAPNAEPARSANIESFATTLPDNTAFFAWKSLERPIGLNDLLFSPAQPAADFTTFMAPWMGQSAGYVLVDPATPGMLEDQFYVFSCRDASRARQLLTGYGQRGGLLRTYDYQTYEVWQFLSQSLLKPLLSADRPEFANPVATIINGYVVFASSNSALELWIDKYVVGQTLGNLPEFLLCRKKTQQETGFQVFFNTQYLDQTVQRVFNSAFSENNLSDIRRIQAQGLHLFNFHWNSQASRYAAEWVAQPRQGPAFPVNIWWKTALAAPAHTRPFIVEQGPAQAAILIQDEQHRLTRLSETGNILWHKQLDQPILSEVQGLDFYKNGKPCFVFNTADAIWLIDDTGNDLSGYPLRLQSPATNGLAAVDIAGDRNYSFFVACHNGNMYGFDQFGRPLPGWNPQPNIGRVKHPLVFFKNGEQDFFAVQNLSGELFVFKKNGSPHFSTLRFPGTFANTPLQADAGSPAPRLSCANDAGEVFVCNLSGYSFSLRPGPGMDANSFFVFEQLFGDARKDYVWASGKRLRIFGYEGATFDQKYTSQVAASIDTLFSAGCCQKIGAANFEKRQVYLFDSNGKVYPGFPIGGTTAFRLLPPAQGRPEQVLIVGNGASVYAYKLN